MQNEEQAALLIRNSITKHEGIVDILSMYRRNGFLDIVFPLASTDLEGFMMSEEYDGIWDHMFDMSRLLLAIRHLASGLKFIHQGLEDPVRRSSILCHMDFRPNNILVYLKEESEGLDKIEFRICDFGIAKIQPKPYQVPPSLFPKPNSSRFTPVTHTKTGARRFTGTHQAPEMYHNPGKVGRKSDVWSLASIIIRLLTRQLLGKKELDRFDERRADLNDEDEDFFFSDSSPTVLNEAVAGWLNDLSDPESELCSLMVARLQVPSQRLARLRDVQTIPQRLSTILRNALEVEAEKRSSSAQLHEALMDLSY